MSIPLQFSNNPITVFVYEPFSYTISNPGPYTLTISNTPGIPPGYLVNNGSNVVFSASSNAMPSGNELFVITARDGSNIIATSSNTVAIKPGRFTDASGSGYSLTDIYTFYKGEPITPLRLVAPFAIPSPTATPTLPPGLTFVSNASNDYSIAGTPLVTVPQSNYLFIGKATGSNLGKIVTSQFGIVISNERLLLNLNGSPVVSPMGIGTAISPRTITATFPPYPSGGTIRYFWSGLPDGIFVTDASGTTRSSGFMPTDASYTLVVTGTPTLAAANAFRDAGITSNVINFQATRVAPTPVISNSISLAFAFGETVLFDTTNVPTLYTGVTLDSTAISYRAQTYFGTGSAIADISSPDLPPNLTLNFVAGSGRAYLTGTPAEATSGTYTIRATNSNGIIRDYLSPITSVDDTISFAPPSPAVDVCYNFVISRPSSLALTGYYPSNIQFQASAASGKPVTFTAPGLAGTGLSLSNVSANVVQIVGIPNTVTPLTDVTLTVSAVGTPATASRNFKLAVLDDTITITDISASLLTFIQNRAITPIQLSATTLSERAVISYTSPNMPSGVSISTTGRISGTPLGNANGSFTVIASTGYSTASKSYSYTITPDSMLFFVNPQSYTYQPSANVSIDINALSYSGTTASNYVFSNFAQSYGLSVDSGSGVISGTLTDSIPPNALLPVSCNFFVNATAGSITGTLPASLTTANAVVSWRHVMFSPSPNDSVRTYYKDEDGTLWNQKSTSNVSAFFGSISFVRKNNILDSNVLIYSQLGNANVGRSTNIIDFRDVSYAVAEQDYPQTSSLANKTGTSTWWLIGQRQVGFFSSERAACLFISHDDGRTWNSGPVINITGNNFYTRDSNTVNVIGSPYVNGGAAIAYKSGVLMIGGGYDGANSNIVTLRSTNDGSNWTTVTNGMQRETAYFSLEHSNVWVMTGSDVYTSIGNGALQASSARTIKYSTNQGVTWSNTTGDFNRFAYDVQYGTNGWLVAGVQADGAGGFNMGLRYSSDGSNWTVVDLSTNPLFPTSSNIAPIAPMQLGPIGFDGIRWSVFVVRLTDVGNPLSLYRAEIYTHDTTSPMTSGWVVENVTTQFSPGASSYFTNFLPPTYVRLGTPTVSTLSFNSTPSGGPTFTSPTQTSYLLYQYVTIAPITFTATGTGQVYYFVDNATLPRGLTFDPVTGILSGTSVLLGDVSFTVYAKDDIGVTAIRIGTTTVIPTVVRQQTSAGAWTSLVRQYTVVNSAQNSVNGHVLPAGEATLGEFMRPEPLDSVSAPGDPNCVKTRGKC